MKGFHNLVVLGILLVTLLFVIDTINAGRKEPKKKEIENKNVYTKKIKLSENNRPGKGIKSNTYKNLEGEYKQFNEDPKFETKKYKVKKGTKYTTKDSKIVEEGTNPKITKTYKKVKKYKVVEDEPAQNFGSRLNVKKVKPQISKGETYEQVIQSLKKTSQKTSASNPEIDDIVNEELKRFYGEENIVGDEDNANSPTRKKYKLVEVVLEEDGEEEKGENEPTIEVGNEMSETEEVIEKYKTTQTVQLNAEDNSELENNENSDPEDDSYSSRYDNPSSQQSNCKPVPEDPNRKGPKKLTFYVIEEEINGQVRKRVIPEEDGVTMCEVADLLRENYYGGLI